MEGKGGNSEDGGEEDNTGNIGRDCRGRTSLRVDLPNLFGDVVTDVKGTNGSFVDVDGVDESAGVAATASTASSSRTTSSRGGKRLSGALTGGRGKKNSKTFPQPLWIPRKSSSNASDEVEDG